MEGNVRIMEAEELNQEQKSQVQGLWRLCREKEPVTQDPFVDGEENAAIGLPCFYLRYQGEMLVSFLSLFIPDGSYAEVSGYTVPQERGKGYFSALLQRAAAHLKKADIPLYLVSDRKSADACGFIRRNGLEAAWEEWMMESFAGKLRLLPVRCDASKYRLEREGDGWTLLEEKAGKRLGSCRLSSFLDGVYLYDFAIDEGERRKGYGRLFLKLLGENLDAEKTVFLQVGTYNEPACCLYEACGFTVRERLSYYRL